MGKQSNRRLMVFLPLALVATFVVAVCPLLFVWWLRGLGIVSSAWAAVGLSVGLSFGASYAGGALWKTRTGAEDVLFGELMLWGWVHRWRIERRLSAATDLLGLTGGIPGAVVGGRLTHEQRANLLSQLASTLEARDPYTHGHSRRVARHASNMARRMGVSTAQLDKVRAAAALHDVGKVKTPNAVLHKEGKLTTEEFEVVARHPVEGATMVSTLRDDELTAMVRHHHERLDGTGYPDRLSGDAIPIGARIIAVADTFDAITSTRPYRPAHTHKQAIDILRAEAGTQLDPEAVRAFCSCYAGMRPLAWWTILTSLPQRVVSWFGEGLGAANAASVANVMAIVATTGAMGGVALGALGKAPTPSHRKAPSATRSRHGLTASSHSPATRSARPGGGSSPAHGRGRDGGDGGAAPALARGVRGRSVARSAHPRHARGQEARTSASSVAQSAKRDHRRVAAPSAGHPPDPAVTPTPAPAPAPGAIPGPGAARGHGRAHRRAGRRGLARGHRRDRGPGHRHRGATGPGVARGRGHGPGRPHRRTTGRPTRGSGQGHGQSGTTAPARGKTGPIGAGAPIKKGRAIGRFPSAERIPGGAPHHGRGPPARRGHAVRGPPAVGSAAPARAGRRGRGPTRATTPTSTRRPGPHLTA